MVLTGAEFDLLYSFLRNPGKIISREDLTQAALGRPMSPMDRSIDVHVSNLGASWGLMTASRSASRPSAAAVTFIFFRESSSEIPQPVPQDIFLLLAGRCRNDRRIEPDALVFLRAGPNPERRRGALGEALNLYAESAVQVYDSEGPQAFEQYVNRSLKEAGTEIELFDGNGKPLTAAHGGRSAATWLLKSRPRSSTFRTLRR